MKKKKTSPKPTASLKLATALLGVAAAETLLSIYQWVEYAGMRHGIRPSCSINDLINCETVWTSALAQRLHAWLGVPVAGLGLVWGLAAVLVTAVAVMRIREGREAGPTIFATRVLAAAGVLAVVVFASESLRVKAVCLTCLGTYALALAFAVLAWKVSASPLRPAPSDLNDGLKWTAGSVFGTYVVSLGVALLTGMGPGSMKTDVERLQQTQNPEMRAITSDEERLAAYLARLPSQEQQAIADALAYYRVSVPLDTSAHPIRRLFGPKDAPLKMVEFTDIRCSHCKMLSETIRMLKQVVPPGSLSIESRYFPLDKECNPLLPGTDGTGVRCLGAKAQICLEQAPDFWELHDKLFAAQDSLTTDKILEIASSGSVSRAELEKCIASPETEAKLKDDIAYAGQYDPSGTPLVILNGREGFGVGPFLYALAVTRGDPDSPAFRNLPPPRLLQ